VCNAPPRPVRIPRPIRRWLLPRLLWGLAIVGLVVCGCVRLRSRVRAEAVREAVDRHRFSSVIALVVNDPSLSHEQLEAVLMAAVRAGDPRIVLTLLANGADPNARERNRCATEVSLTPSQHAVQPCGSALSYARFVTRWCEGVLSGEVPPPPALTRKAGWQQRLRSRAATYRSIARILESAGAGGNGGL